MNSNQPHLNIGELMRQASVALQQNQLQQAVHLFQQVLRQQPQQVAALHGMGEALQSMGQLDAALQCFDEALQLRPEASELHNSKGTVLYEMDRLQEALISYDSALQLRGDAPAVWLNRGLILHRLQRFAEAEKSLSQAIQLQPDYVDAHYCRVMTLFAAGRHAEALQAVNLILHHLPNFVRAWNLRGQLLNAMGNAQEALASCDRCLQLEPNDAEAWLGRATAQNSMQMLAEAVDSYSRALALNPQLGFVQGLAIHARARICDWRDIESQVEKLVSCVKSRQAVTQPFAVLPLVDDPQIQYQAAQLWLGNHPQEVIGLPHIVRRAPRNKIRLGYFSADFHNHATAHLMAELFELHDRSQFEVIAFSFGPSSDDLMRQRLIKAFDQFIDVHQLSDRDVVLKAREMEIDIAVDLKGYTQDCRESIFVQRAAPIQVSYIGTPGTMGSEQWDYIIADKMVIPEDQQQYFAEKVAYLPHCYQVNDRKREVADRVFTRSELNLPESGFVFCCFNNCYKILPDVFASWMRILQQVSGSVLWLLQDHEATMHNLRSAARHCGIDEHRLIFAERISSPMYLARFQIADLFLDTFPYTAHTTSSDALRAGVPVLTRKGRSFASRVAASILQDCELLELITTSSEKYETLAIRLANTPAMLTDIRRKIQRAIHCSPMFDTPRFTRHIESAYHTMYDRYVANLPPAPFSVPEINNS